MPCYEVNTMSIEFKAKYKKVLVEALKRSGLNPREYESRSGGHSIYAGDLIFRLDEQKVTFQEDQQVKLNEIRRKYSEVVLEQVAKKRRRLLKKSKAEGNFQLVKY